MNTPILQRQADGENWDIDAIVQSIADQAAGLDRSDALFTSKQRVDRGIVQGIGYLSADDGMKLSATI